MHRITFRVTAIAIALWTVGCGDENTSSPATVGPGAIEGGASDSAAAVDSTTALEGSDANRGSVETFRDAGDPAEREDTSVTTDTGSETDGNVADVAPSSDANQVIEIHADEQNTLVLDIVSPSTCAVNAYAMGNCTVPTRKILAMGATVPPARITKLSSIVTGNCSTQYPLALKVEIPDSAPVSFHYLSDKTFWVRAKGGEAVSSVTLSDEAPIWTRSAVLDKSCTIQLKVELNVADDQ